jgi:hypothetical protein
MVILDLRRGGEVANTAVCRTAIRGCKSHSRLPFSYFVMLLSFIRKAAANFILYHIETGGAL